MNSADGIVTKSANCTVEEAVNKIGRITTAGAITGADEFVIPTPNSFPLDITAGPDGNLWFTEYRGTIIGKASLGLVTPPTLTPPRITSSSPSVSSSSM